MEIKIDGNQKLIVLSGDDLRLLLNTRWVLVSYQNTHGSELALIDQMLDSQAER